MENNNKFEIACSTGNKNYVEQYLTEARDKHTVLSGFLQAIAQSHMGVVKEILNYLNAKDVLSQKIEFSNQGFETAVSYHQNDMVKLFLEIPNFKNNFKTENKDLYMDIVKMNDPEILKDFLKIPIAGKEDPVLSGLIYAARYRKENSLNYLIDNQLNNIKEEKFEKVKAFFSNFKKKETLETYTFYWLMIHDNYNVYEKLMNTKIYKKVNLNHIFEQALQNNRRFADYMIEKTEYFPSKEVLAKLQPNEVKRFQDLSIKKEIYSNLSKEAIYPKPRM